MPATRTVNDEKDAGGVVLNALFPVQDYLVYTVTVGGSQAGFLLFDATSGQPLLESDDSDQQTYTRRWPTEDEAEDLSPGVFQHVLEMKFLKAALYRFVVERFNSSDELREVLTDVVWRSQTADTTRSESFTVDVPEEP